MSLKHYKEIVLPTIREYRLSEYNLTESFLAKKDTEDTNNEVLRRARTAAIELNHMADHFVNCRGNISLEETRALLLNQCYYLRESNICDDVKLIRDLADSFKHKKISRSNKKISDEDQVLTIGKVFGEGPLGEGKYGGVPETRVMLDTSSIRAFSTIVQNSVDAWRRVLGVQLPPMGDFNS